MLLNTSIASIYVIVCVLLQGYSIESKTRYTSELHRQEHLLNTLPSFEISYPTEVSHTGRHIRHVTTSHRRSRRSIAHNDGLPVYYSVRYGGKTYRMKLRVNDKLLGSGFVVEWHKKGGKIEKRTHTDHCYLVGEVQDSLHSAAISDCDGLSGVIDIGDDVIYIEPIINETSYRGYTGNGTKRKPHLLYRKSSLHKAEGVGLDMSDDYMSAANAHAPGVNAQFQYRAGRESHIRIINRAERPVRVLYMNGNKESLFSLFKFREQQNVNTFTSHRWLVRDDATNKRLLIGGKKLYSPRPTTSRISVEITIPKGLKLPKYQKPDPPDSRIKIVNQSGRFVQIFFIDHDNKRKLFTTMIPGEAQNINTYSTHRWYANDYDTGKPLWLNTRLVYVAVATSFRRTLIVTVPPTLRLPRLGVYPDLLSQPPKYIEVMVAADPSVVEHHGKDKVERYVLTLMNIVSRIFHHKSIGLVIHFVVVRLILLEENPKQLKITKSPMDSLNRVCYWGHKQRKGWDKTSREFYDQTVFLTKKDFGPSGYAPVSSMCYRTRSCTLNDDDSFTSSFIVAHETGHTLGMEHDGVRNNCSKDVIKGSIMAPLVRSRFDRFYWSECSRRELIDNLDHLWCLDDVPFKFNRTLMSKLPGQIYDRDEQCAMDFGKGFSPCYMYTSNPCTNLWCDNRSRGSYCRTRRTAPLEGTSCGRNKWCRLGHCVRVTKDGSFEIPTPKPTPKPIHGNWSVWSTYEACSLTCGSGVRIRSRACNNPSPQHGGRECEGPSYDIAMCHNKPCVGVTPSFTQILDQQCRNLVSADGKKDWVFYNVYKANLDCDFETDLCSWTNSKYDNFDWTPNTGKTSSSGTGPSFDHTKGLGGKGTYLYMESSRPTDVGWRARLVSRLVAKHVTCLSFWYHSYGEDDHFGSLQLLLNTTSREKRIWSISEDLGNKWRQKMVTILSVMPYRIVFQAIRGDGYRSDIAIDDITFTSGACKRSIKPSIEENNIPMAPCYTYCGSTFTNKVVKIRVKDGTRCYENPAINDVCVNGQCQAVGCDGKAGSLKVYDNCGICNGNNDTCTINKGVITTILEEEEETILECPVGATNIFVEEFNESPNFLTVQIIGVVNKTLINGNANASDPGVYEIAGTRFVYSRDEGSEKLLALGPLKEGIVVKTKNTKKDKNKSPVLVKYKYYKPNKEPTIYVWKPVGWSKCSKPCGGGSQKRIYDCYRKKPYKKVKHKLCYGISRKRPYKQTCNIDPCEVNHFWKISPWSACSVTCSNGFQVRGVKCIATLYGQPNKTVVDANCEGEKPLVSKNCSKKECVAMWKTGPWSACSKTCGRGLRTRTVKCLDRRNEPSLLCTEESRLGTTSYCTLTKCVDNAPVVVGNLSCTFEAGYCRWRNSRQEDEFDWTLRSGATPSRYTGPNYDHTFRSSRKHSGKYIFCEASAPQNYRDRARLYSPRIDMSKICLDFWFHMLGDKMGSINVYIMTKNSLAKLWSKKGNQGGRWQNKMIQISSATSFRIVIEGVRGPGYSSDMALDDITVYTGICPKSKYFRPKCKADRSRYCRLAVRFSWCSSSVWGNRLCCKSCSKTTARHRQRRLA